MVLQFVQTDVGLEKQTRCSIAGQQGGNGAFELERLTNLYLLWMKHARTLSHTGRPLSARSGPTVAATGTSIEPMLRDITGMRGAVSRRKNEGH